MILSGSTDDRSDDFNPASQEVVMIAEIISASSTLEYPIAMILQKL